MSAWRKADVDEQKATLTRCVDHGRRAYGYEARSYPRRTCLAFSLNDTDPFQDATGDRRYWPVDVIRELGRRRRAAPRPRSDIGRGAARLKGGEQHWPTEEEEERLIVPEQQKYVPTAALEILAILARFIVEEPLTTAAEPRGLRLEMAAPTTTV